MKTITNFSDLKDFYRRNGECLVNNKVHFIQDFRFVFDELMNEIILIEGENDLHFEDSPKKLNSYAKRNMFAMLVLIAETNQ